MLRSLELIVRGFLCVGVLSAPAFGQELGTAPAATLDVTDVFKTFRLPPLKNTADSGLISVLSGTQVGQRAQALSLNGDSAVQAWKAAAELIEWAAKPVSCGSGPDVEFSGSSAKELNRLIGSGARSIFLTADALNIDEPIVLHSGMTLQLSRTQLVVRDAAPYALRIEGVDCVEVSGGEMSDGEAGILIADSRNVWVESMVLRDFSADGFVVDDSSRVVLSGNRMQGMQGAGIVLSGGTNSTVLQHNDLTDNHGTSNFTPGILITDRDTDLISDLRARLTPDYWTLLRPVIERRRPPHDNAIVFNRISRNRAGGIHVDGGVRNVIESNLIQDNAKEGLCLDSGASGNLVASNTIERDGGRWGESDEVLKRDQVAAGGRLPDGTAAAKLPGVSMDNALYNIIFSNRLAHNYGGGIKIIRTGYFNVIGMNTIFSNNDGASTAFHFFGIELGSGKGNAAPDDLDSTPSRGNIVFSNIVRGNHYAGIFLGAGSDENDVFDNTILDATNWALESVSVMANHTLNNLTTLPSRNVSSGLDPHLIKTSEAVLDKTH